MTVGTINKHATYKQSLLAADNSQYIISVLYMTNVWSHAHFPPWQGDYLTSKTLFA